MCQQIPQSDSLNPLCWILSWNYPPIVSWLATISRAKESSHGWLFLKRLWPRRLTRGQCWTRQVSSSFLSRHWRMVSHIGNLRMCVQLTHYFTRTTASWWSIQGTQGKRHPYPNDRRRLSHHTVMPQGRMGPAHHYNCTHVYRLWRRPSHPGQQQHAQVEQYQIPNHGQR